RKQILDLLETQSFDEDLLDQWVSDRRNALQRAGHYRAKVSASLASAGNPIPVTLTVEPGPKYSVESITIQGNASVPEETLRRFMVTHTRGLPIIERGRLIDRDLDDDVSAILGYYQTRGWIDAKVQRSVTDGSEPGRLAVPVTVSEGPRAFVEERTVEGAEHLTAADIERLVTLRVGEPFNPSAVRQDVSALTDFYWNHGWREASVQDHYTLSEDRTKATIIYRVDEGMRSFFGKAIIR